MRMNIVVLIASVCLLACTSPVVEDRQPKASQPTLHLDSTATILIDRHLPPDGYTTVSSTPHSFAHYLQHLPLKAVGTSVQYYNGDTKPNRNVYCGVVDMDIDPVDLQQCADAVMRLRGEYLYKEKKYAELKFNFLSDGKPRYYTDYAKGDYSYAKFRKYMKYIFSYANTASLRNELTPTPLSALKIGDVLIQKGNPYGHAVLVVNRATDTAGHTVYMLAQSYMPAQDTQILTNPRDDKLSPWYTLAPGDIHTPEWTFTDLDLRSF